MKFSLFAHMERISSEEDQKRFYDEFIELCKIADDGGMHSVWTGEHHGMNLTIAPNPLLNLVDLAHHTKNVRLGTGTVIAPFWHPIRLTGEAESDEDVKIGAVELNRFYCYFGAWFMNKRDTSQGLIDLLTDDEIAAHPFYSPEAMERDLVIGTADTVI